MVVFFKVFTWWKMATGKATRVKRAQLHTKFQETFFEIETRHPHMYSCINASIYKCLYIYWVKNGILLPEEGLHILLQHRKVKYPQKSMFLCFLMFVEEMNLSQASLMPEATFACHAKRKILLITSRWRIRIPGSADSNWYRSCLLLSFFIRLTDESCLQGKLLGGHEKSSPLQLFLSVRRRLIPECTYRHYLGMCTLQSQTH